MGMSGLASELRQRVRRAFPAVLACACAMPAAGRAASAQETSTLQYPLAVAAAADGTIFVVDLDLPGVWRVTGDQLEVFFQGQKTFRTPLNAPRSVVLDAAGGPLVGCTPTRQIYRFDENRMPQGLIPGGVGIGLPMSIAVNPDGEIFVADLELHVVWKLPAEGGEPVKFVDVPAPRGLAFDKEGHLWVVSHSQQQLVRVAPDGTITPIVKERVFEFQHNVVVDDALTAYVSDGYARAIWKIPFGQAPEKWVSGAPLESPVGLAWHGKNVLVADPRAEALFEIDPDGKLTKLDLKPAAAP
jgi:sugar lactone lactonase YvrE